MVSRGWLGVRRRTVALTCLTCAWPDLSKLEELRVLDLVCNNLKKLPKVSKWSNLLRLDARSNCLQVRRCTRQRFRSWQRVTACPSSPERVAPPPLPCLRPAGAA